MIGHIPEIDAILAPLAEAHAWDIQVPGYLERDENPPRFCPVPAMVYVALEDGFLRIGEVEYQGQLKISLVASPGRPIALEDSDDEFVLASFGQPFLAEAYSKFRITGARYVANDGSDPVSGVIRCIEFTFENSFPVFMDPMYYFGIRLGGAGAYERWLAADQRDPGPFGPPREFVWSP